AKVEICVPSRERAWPPQSKTKSRLHHTCEEDSLCKRFCLHIGVEIGKLSYTAKWHSQLLFLRRKRFGCIVFTFSGITWRCLDLPRSPVRTSALSVPGARPQHIPRTRGWDDVSFTG